MSTCSWSSPRMADLSCLKRRQSAPTTRRVVSCAPKRTGLSTAAHRAPVDSPGAAEAPCYPTSRMSRTNLLDLLPAEMEDLAASQGVPRYRGRQLATWIFQKGATALDLMSDLPKGFRRDLGEVAEIRLPEIERVTPSQDGSRKLVVRMADGGRVQSVLMP